MGLLRTSVDGWARFWEEDRMVRSGKDWGKKVVGLFILEVQDRG